MAYADQSMSGNRIIALIIVALIHIVVGYTLVTGLAYSAIKQVVERVTTVDIEEEIPEEEEPPPPPEPDTAPPPPVAPPAPININPAPPPIETRPTIPPPAPVARIVPPSAPPAPVNRVQPKDPEPRGNPGNWATPNDYPRRALREEREGTTGFRVSVNTDGRVTDCQITRSSGHADLDEATCQNITRRARFRAATDGNGDPTSGSYSNSVRWVIPD